MCNLQHEAEGDTGTSCTEAKYMEAAKDAADNVDISQWRTGSKEREEFTGEQAHLELALYGIQHQQENHAVRQATANHLEGPLFTSHLSIARPFPPLRLASMWRVRSKSQSSQSHVPRGKSRKYEPSVEVLVVF